MILFGSNYFVICTIFARNTLFCPTFSTLMTWRAYNTFWGVFVLIWDLVPVTMIVLVLVQPDLSHMHLSLIVLKRMFNVDKRFTSLYLLQVLLTVGFFVMSYLLLNTTVFGSDRMSYCIRHFNILLLGLHTVFKVLLLQRIPIIFKLVSTKTDMIVPTSIVSERESPKNTLSTTR
ncbi:hypothetical protein BC833DRAFT_106868 [Globomyces pollinis-pini]|nr:hypothetical protein BC833DRAFT_106868 [Globomyces pollinis-pini]